MSQNRLARLNGQALIHIFSQLEDPRVPGRCSHKLIDIIVITVCAIACGIKHWNTIEEFAKQRKTWLKRFLELPNGIPSHQTFCRIFSLIPPEDFLNCFTNWVSTQYATAANDIIAIDGKTVRKSGNKNEEQKPLHLINAYSTNQGITLGSIKTPDKSNEIKGIPPLLKSLNIEGSVITMDAMGTQKGIANLIRLRKADYVLALKNNHKRFYKSVDQLFTKADQLNYQAMVYKTHTTTDYDHSRYEKREYTVLPLMYLPLQKQTWNGLQSFVRVKSTRSMRNEEQTSVRYYISSLALKFYRQTAKAIRRHWGIENRLHWKLDVAMQEDACRIYHPNSAENFSTLRKLVLQLLENESSVTKGIVSKQYKAIMSPSYLKKVVGF